MTPDLSKIDPVRSVIRWDEPADAEATTNRECRCSVVEALARQRKAGGDRALELTDQRLLEDFVAVHWAWFESIYLK